MGGINAEYMGTHPIFESDFDCLTDRTGPNLPIMTEQMTFKGSLKGHNGWVTQIATTPIFPDMLLSAARDRTIKLWNTVGVCKFTIQENCHTEWVSCVRFSPLPQTPVIVSAGWDKLVKVWNLTNCKLKRDYRGHTGYLNTVNVSPDGSLCASGGRDG